MKTRHFFPLGFALLAAMVLLGSRAAEAQLPDSPLQAYWTFDSGYASAVNNAWYQGTPYGGSYTSITGAPGTYIRGTGALRLNSGPASGNITYVRIPNPVADVTRDRQITVSAWYNYTDVSGDGSDLRKFVWESAPDYSLAFGLRTEGTTTDAEWWFKDLVNNVDGPVIQPGTWNHAVMVLDMDMRRAQFYHNGQLRDDVEIGTTVIPAMTAFHIGNHRAADGTRDFDGYIDDVAVYHGVLDADGVAGLYNGTYTPATVPVLDTLPPPPDKSFTEPAPFVAGSWSMVVMPDTQHYTNATDAPILHQMTQWIVDNKEARNIGMVLHMGDLTNDNSDAQWTIAKAALSRLDGHVPYVLSTGNHDYSSSYRSTRLNNYFAPSNNPLNDPAQGGILRETYQANKLENAFYEFTAPDGRKMLIFSLEFGPRQEVLDWANSVASREEFSGHSAFVVTHSYLYNDNTRYDWDLYGTAQSANPHSYSAFNVDTNDGQEMWEELVGQHAQFEGVFCGHVIGQALTEADGVGYLASTGQQGNLVQQMLFNAQHVSDNGGNGWLRLLEFQPDGKTVVVKTYSPYLDAEGLPCWRVDEDDWFSFELSPLWQPGDANGDGRVDVGDAQRLAAHWGQTGGWPDGDFNGDGLINAADASILAANWEPGAIETRTVPEPGTLALSVGVALVAAIRSRRRSKAADTAGRRCRPRSCPTKKAP